MADFNNNDIQNKVAALNKVLSDLANSGNATIFEILDMQKKLESILQDFPISEIKNLRKQFKDSNDEIKDVLDSVYEQYKSRLQTESQYQKQIDELTDKIKEYNDILNSDNDYLSDITEEKKKEAEKQLEELKNQHQHRMDVSDTQYQLEQEQQERDRKSQEDANEKLKSGIDKTADIISKFTSDILTRFTNAVNNNVNIYEQNSGKLAAILNTTTESLGSAQRKLAEELRDTSLSKAISNIEVLTEMSSLASSGYTAGGVEGLEERAIAVAEARKVAPSIDIDSSTVKNLTNVFGTDFITRFSAIQSAVQDTAGSTAFLSQNLSKMIDDLSPVIEAAELQQSETTLQGISDVNATIEAAIRSGTMEESQAQSYRNMITELMDPAKAYKSSNIAVRVAAQTYDVSSMDPVAALEALRQAQQQMYGNIGMGMSSTEMISRGLVASAYNQDTMSATYMPTGLYNFEIQRTGELGEIAERDREKLEAGDYTTRSKELVNMFENSALAQNVSKIAQNSPLIYGALSGTIIASINSLPIRIANAMKGSNLFSSSITTNLGNTINNSTDGMSGRLLTAGKSLGKSALALGATTAAMYTISQYDPHKYDDEGSTEGGTVKEVIAAAGHQGNLLTAGASGAILGAQIGSFGGPMGTAIGGVAGGVAGLITASLTRHFDKTAEKLEKNTEALEKSTGATKTLTEGITSVDALESKRELARGGGIVSSDSGDYKISYKKSTHAGFATGLDYVPYDDFVFRAHKGEAIVTAEAATKLRQQDPNFWNNPIFNKQQNTFLNDDSNIVGALKEQTESIVNAVNGEKQFAPLTKSGPTQYTIKNAFT